MFNNNKRTSLNRKRDGTFSNSTGSCTYDGIRAYSYSELILLKTSNKTKSYSIFNWHRFSNTTSKHQFYLREKRLSLDFSINVNSMNQIEEAIKRKTLDQFLIENGNELLESEKLLEFLGYSKRKIKKVLEYFKEKAEKEKATKNFNARFNKYEKKLRGLDFKTPEDMIEKIKEYDLSGSRIGLNINGPLNESQINFLKALKKLDAAIFKLIDHNLKKQVETKIKLEVFTELGD